MTGADPPAFDPAAVFAADRGEAGLAPLCLPGFAEPLWLRPGTADAATCAATFAAAAPVPFIRHSPRRILELGTGAGYRAVRLAHSFPDAEILSLATDLPAGRVALLNTLPYRNIGLAILGAAHLLPHLLARHGWDVYDTVILTAPPEAPALHPWPDSVRLVAIQNFVPPAAAYPAELFAARRQADYHLFYRLLSTDLPPPPPRHLFDPATPQSAPANLTTHCPGARTLKTRLRAGPDPVHLTIHFHTETEPRTLLAEETIPAHRTLAIEADLPPWFGPCQIGFETGTSARLDLLDAVLV